MATMMNKYIFRIIPLCVLLLARVASSDVHEAATCNLSDVNTAISAASDGDSVSIPAGNCTWSSAWTLNTSGRSLTVYGAGESGGTQTIITLTASLGSPVISITTSAGKLLDLSRIHFSGLGSSTYYDGQWSVAAPSGTDNTYRIHHIVWDGIPSSAHYILRASGGGGLWDHMTWTASGGASGGVAIGGFTDVSTNTIELGTLWDNSTLIPGNSNAVFVEDSTFTSGAWDSYIPFTNLVKGQRYVIRHNTINNAGTGSHSYDTDYVGPLYQVVDSNTFNYTYPSSGSIDHIVWQRGGILVASNNTFNLSGTTTLSANSIPLINYRYGASDGDGNTPTSKYSCTVSNPTLKVCSWVNNDWTYTSPIQPFDCKVDADCTTNHTGATCKWKICSNSTRLCEVDGDCSGGTCSRYLDAESGSAPCFLQVGTGPKFVNYGAYQWNNNLYHVDVDPGTAHAMAFANRAGYVENTDYFNRQPQSGDALYPYAYYSYPHPLAGGVDNIPDSFSFTDVTGADLSTVTTTSPCATIAGIEAGQTPAISISGAGCTYNVDGGAYTSDAGTVGLDNVVCLRVTSSASYSTAKSCTLTMGGVSDTWTVTTLAAANDPVAPRFRGSSMSGGWR